MKKRFDPEDWVESEEFDNTEYDAEYESGYDAEDEFEYDAEPDMEYNAEDELDYEAGSDEEYGSEDGFAYDVEDGFEYNADYSSDEELNYDAEYMPEDEIEYDADYDPDYGSEIIFDPDGEEIYEESEGAEYYEEFEDFEEYEDPGYGDGDISGSGRKSPKKQKKSLGEIFRNMEPADRVMAGLGAAVLVLALICGAVFIRTKLVVGQPEKFETVGAQLEGIEVVGEEGLLALVDAARVKAAADEMSFPEEEPEEEPQKEYEESEYVQKVVVTLKMVSVQRDLKIKFVNKNTDKLISNTPFSLTVTTAANKTETWADDDKDGIIYRKDIEPGDYRVSVDVLSDSAYAGYVLPEEAQNVEVKKDIAYEKIDVSDEVKTEAQVDVAHEEQKKEELAVESVLTDTVKWVPSTVVEGAYKEVDKKKVTDPSPAAAGTVTPSVSPGDLVQLVQENPSENAGSVAETVYIGIPVSVKMTVANMPADAVMKAKSSDKDVAVVSVEGQTMKIDGVSEGQATITLRCKRDEEELAKAEWTISVKSHPKYDTTTVLRDNKDNPLYIQEGDSYRQAVYADYYKSDVKFYKRGNAKYTGWQTIDGNLYFFNESNEKVTGEQVIQGAKYNFASDGSLVAGSGTMGIDVSKHNGDIDWNAVKNSGVAYVIIRCGYRGYTEGVLIEDPKFRQNIKGATAVGLKVGVYFFSQAVDEVEAVAEASFVLDAVKGYKISYPIFLDVESSGAPGHSGRADGLDLGTRTAVCKAFCATISSGGYTAGIYANKTWLTGKIDPGQLGGYKIWLAQYAAQPTYAGRFDMWQYQSSGQVSGINGRVDMNISYLGY